MLIVCGTDFSAGSDEAVRVAAMFAAKLGGELRLAHVVDELGAELVFRERQEEIVYASARVRLGAAAKTARELGARVEEVLAPGSAAELLAELAETTGARMLVLASRGERGSVLLGSVSERVSRAASTPVLVVRAAAPFERWLSGERPLAVMVGVQGADRSSDAAISWIGELQRLGPCDVTLAHVTSAEREHDRLGVPGPIHAEQLHPDVQAALVRDLERRAGECGLDAEVRFLPTQSFGSVEQQLVKAARDAQVDLLVVGAHQRAGIARIWHRSVSRDVLHLAPMSVATVPRQRERMTHQPPILRRVLAATDFSVAGDRATAYAFSLLPTGGAVHLVHVLAPAMGKTPITQLLSTRARPPDEWLRVAREADERLQQLVPPNAPLHGIDVSAEIFEGDVAEEVCRAAARIGVDVICLGSRGRSPISSALLGSVAQGVLSKSHCPVLVVPPDE
jgi:nucleotide-binding universal stress UspA family protein